MIKHKVNECKQFTTAMSEAVLGLILKRFEKIIAKSGSIEEDTWVCYPENYKLLALRNVVSSIVKGKSKSFTY